MEVISLTIIKIVMRFSAALEMQVKAYLYKGAPMKKLTFFFAIILLFLSSCQDNPDPSRDISLTPMPTIQPSTDTPSPIPSPSPTLSPTPTEAGVLQDGILYCFVTVEGLTEIRQKNGEGIALDLNGDGVMEYLYTCEEGIFINGIKQTIDYDWNSMKPTEYPEARQLWEAYWIADVDISDNYYNLIFQFSTASSAMEALTYYDGTLKQIAEQDLFYDSGFSKAEYRGDNTYLMPGSLWDFMGQQYPTEIEYHLIKDAATGNITEAWIYTECIRDEKGKYIMHNIEDKNAREIFNGFSEAG